MITVPLPSGAQLCVFVNTRYVETRWDDGLVCGATRAPTAENIAEGASQGYAATAEGCWRSLVDHAALHSIVALTLWEDNCSAPLRHEAGDARPYWMRLYEEAIVLALQGFVNGGEITPPLRPYRQFVPGWVRELAGVWARLGDELVRVA